MKKQDYITDLYETRNRFFDEVLNAKGNEKLAFEVMAAGKAFTTDKHVATIMTMDQEHYIEVNGGYPFKLKLQERTKEGGLDNVQLANPAITDEFNFTAATDHDAKKMADLLQLKTGAQSGTLLLLEAGLYEAVCYRLLISFTTKESPVRIVVYKANVWHQNVTWMYEHATTCGVEEARGIIDEYGRETWNAAMDHCGITGNPYD